MFVLQSNRCVHMFVLLLLLLWRLTLLSPLGASGSVIHEPNLDPDVLMVIGSEIPVSFPQAERHTAGTEMSSDGRSARHGPARRAHPPSLCMQALSRSSRLSTRPCSSW